MFFETSHGGRLRKEWVVQNFYQAMDAKLGHLNKDGPSALHSNDNNFLNC